MIFTFYSYKGGVGRSMAMASIAHVLARRGLRVLAIDFDLEAPGLERYFFDGERSKNVRAQPGLLDLIQAYRQALSSEVAFEGGEFKRWQNFCLSAINVAGTLGGSVDLMTSGKREPDSAKQDYSLAVRSFDWQDFFYNWKGDLFFDWLRRQLRNPETGYDVVLVDSRTGVTEMGGVCAYQLADVAVLLCAPNYQNLDGTLDVVRDFRSESVRALRRGRSLEILALPARIEATHPGRAAFLELFASELGVEGLPAALAAVGLDYEELALPYLPQLSIAEHLVGEAQPEKGSIAEVTDVFERLADALTLLAAPGTPLAAHQDAALKRLRGGATQPPNELLADTTRSSAGYDAFIDYCDDDYPLVQELRERLEKVGHRTFLDRNLIEGAEANVPAVEQALGYSAVLLVCFGQPTKTERRASTIAHARRLRTVTIIPVLLPGADPRSLASFDLSPEQAVDLREWGDEKARGNLLSLMSTAVGGTSRAKDLPAAAAPERNPYPGARAFAEDDAAFFFGREREVDQLLDALAKHHVVWLTGAAQVGKTSLILAGLLPRLRRMQSEDGPLRFDQIQCFDCAQALPGSEPAVRDGANRLLLIDAVDSFETNGSAPAREARWATLARLIADASEHLKMVLVARDALPPVERAAVMQVLDMHGATHFEVGALARDALQRAIEQPARCAAHLLEPGLAERLIESAGNAHSAVAQIQLALATIWPERKRGWLTNKNLDAAGHLGGIEAQRRRATLDSLSQPERAAARSLFGRLVALSSTYTLTGSPQPWEALATVPAIERIDCVALRDRLASAGLIDLYKGKAADALSDASARELQVALTRPDPTVHYSDAVAALDLRFLLWRDPLARHALRWNGANADALLRGASLAEAQQWLAENGDQLTRKERKFIEASTAAHEAGIEQQRTRENNERAAREARERERREAAEALAAEQGERLKVEEARGREARAYVARLKRGRRWLLSLLAGMVAMSAVAIFQTLQEKQARQQEKEALQQEKQARAASEISAQRARAEAQSADAAARRTEQLLGATNAALESTEQARDAVEASLAARSNQARRQANDDLRAVDSKLLMAQAGIAKVQDTCPIGRRLYLHIARESDRAATRAMVPRLEKAGFIVPGIELVKNTPRASDVRYFHREDEAAARKAADVLADSGLRGVQTRFVEGFEASEKIRPRHYEAWLSLDALPRSAKG